METDKYIYTDSYKTKDVIWDAYSGFVDNYNDYRMLKCFTEPREDPIVTAGMQKYAIFFYDEIRDFVDQFDKLKDCKIHDLMKKTGWVQEDYISMRKIFGQFMVVSGIKNIVKDKDDVGSAVTDNR